MGVAGALGLQALKAHHDSNRNVQQPDDSDPLVPGGGGGPGGSGGGGVEGGASPGVHVSGLAGVGGAGEGGVVASGPGVVAAATATSVPPFLAKLDPTAVMLHFQQVSSYGLLSLNYPILFESFTLNFSWANFIVIPSGHFKSFVNHLQKRNDTETIDEIMKGLSGIEVYSMGLGIQPKDISTIVFFVFLGICAIFTVILIEAITVCTLMAALAGKTNPKKRDLWTSRRVRILHFASNNWIRLVCRGILTPSTMITNISDLR